MSEAHIGEILLDLGLLFGLTYLLAGLLLRLRIPGIQGALLVAMARSVSRPQGCSRRSAMASSDGQRKDARR